MLYYTVLQVEVQSLSYKYIRTNLRTEIVIGVSPTFTTNVTI